MPANGYKLIKEVVNGDAARNLPGHFAAVLTDENGYSRLMHLVAWPDSPDGKTLICRILSGIGPHWDPATIVESGNLGSNVTFEDVEEFLKWQFQGQEYHIGLNDCRVAANAINEKFGSQWARFGAAMTEALGVASFAKIINKRNSIIGRMTSFAAAHGVRCATGVAGVPFAMPVAVAHLVAGEIPCFVVWAANGSETAQEAVKHTGGTLAAVGTGAYIGSFVGPMGAGTGAAAGLLYSGITLGADQLLANSKVCQQIDNFVGNPVGGLATAAKRKITGDDEDVYHFGDLTWGVASAVGRKITGDEKYQYRFGDFTWGATSALGRKITGDEKYQYQFGDVTRSILRGCGFGSKQQPEASHQQPAGEPAPAEELVFILEHPEDIEDSEQQPAASN